MKKTKTEFIYEKIAPNECLLLYRKGECIVYASNIAGTIKIKSARLEKDKKW
jgi:hypothetical protein